MDLMPLNPYFHGTTSRIGEFGRRKTLMFNGYGDQVAHLYDGMNLRENF